MSLPRRGDHWPDYCAQVREGLSDDLCQEQRKCVFARRGQAEIRSHHEDIDAKGEHPSELAGDAVGREAGHGLTLCPNVSSYLAQAKTTQASQVDDQAKQYQGVVDQHAIHDVGERYEIKQVQREECRQRQLEGELLEQVGDDDAPQVADVLHQNARKHKQHRQDRHVPHVDVHRLVCVGKSRLDKYVLNPGR